MEVATGLTDDRDVVIRLPGLEHLPVNGQRVLIAADHPQCKGDVAAVALVIRRLL